jgi:hypothetical protein
MIKTARITGVWYLILAITGLLGIAVFHSQVFVADPQETLLNLEQLTSTARIRLILEFAIVVSQAFTAVWFYKLFKPIDQTSAWTLGLWGTVNAIAIMFSAICMAAAIGIATSPAQVVDEHSLSIQILQNLIKHAWGVGSLFFGLWLFPMGYIIVRSKRMPLWLGRVLIIGGAGYLLSTVIHYSGIEFSYTNYLTIPATIGEFWIIGYMLIFGIRDEK